MGLNITMNKRPVSVMNGDEIANRVKVEIENRYAKARRGINTVMREGAKEIQLLAKDYAPYAPPELGGSPDPRRHLQDAIEIKEERDPNATAFGGKGIKMTVWVNGRRQGRVTGWGRTVSIGTYAWLMHEGLSPYGASGWYSARAGTLAKSPYAGGKYLERAYHHQRQQIIQAAIAAGRKGFK